MSEQTWDVSRAIKKPTRSAAYQGALCWVWKSAKSLGDQETMVTTQNRGASLPDSARAGCAGPGWDPHILPTDGTEGTEQSKIPESRQESEGEQRAGKRSVSRAWGQLQRGRALLKCVRCQALCPSALTGTDPLAPPTNPGAETVTISFDRRGNSSAARRYHSPRAHS